MFCSCWLHWLTRARARAFDDAAMGQTHRKQHYVCLFLCLVACQAHGYSLKEDGRRDGRIVSTAEGHWLTRRRRLLEETSSPPGGDQTDVPVNCTEDGYMLDDDSRACVRCTPPAINEFPSDFFTQEQRQYGAVLLHLIATFYLFAAIALVVNDYFIASLQRLSARLDLTQDVAGATFMAMGSSAPELFAGFIGTFITEGDVGVGAIVGSAVFNILILVFFCSLFATGEVKINSWPVIRDNTFYFFTIALLLVVLMDQTITWYKSLSLVLLYGVYLIAMKFNKPLQARYERLLRWCKSCRTKKESYEDCDEEKPILSSMTPKSEGDATGKNSSIEKVDRVDLQSSNNYNNNVTTGDKDSGDAISGMLPHEFATSTKVWSHWRDKRIGSFQDAGWRLMLTSKFAPRVRFKAACRVLLDQMEQGKRHEILDARAATGISNVDKQPTAKWKRWYVVTFISSITWIGSLSWILVWMITIIGYTFGIPDSVMGITFLAAGTSIPDIVASIAVTRQGMGDMAVSNGLGSNTFDVLLCLGIPWLMKTGIVEPGGEVVVHSGGLKYTVIMLFATVFIVIFSFHLNGWKLSRRLGYYFVCVCAGFVTLSVLLEFNVFTFVNPPPCS